MSVGTAVITSIAGVVVAGLLFRALRRRIPEAVASGLGALILLTAQYPLMLRAGSESLTSFPAWLAWSTLGALAAAGFTSLLRSKE